MGTNLITHHLRKGFHGSNWTELSRWMFPLHRGYQIYENSICPPSEARASIAFWNTIDTACDIWMTGVDMTAVTNVREIMMDGSIFTFGTDDDDIGTISDLENHPRSFLLCYCSSQVLERISLREA